MEDKLHFPPSRSNQHSSTHNSGGKTHSAPPLQLQASPAQKPPKPEQMATELHAEVKVLAHKFSDGSGSGPEQIEIAQRLVELHAQLERRVLDYPENEDTDDIYKVFGGKGDPLIAPHALEMSMHPYKNLGEWKSIAGVGSWDIDDIHASYSKNGKIRSDLVKPDATPEDVRDGIGKDKQPDLKDAIAYGGTLNSNFSLTVDELLSVISIKGEDGGAPNKFEREKIKEYLDHLQTAFRIAGINTVEAQALYLAHSSGETGFAGMTEGQSSRFVDNPLDIEVLTDYKGPTRYRPGGQSAHAAWSVDPHGHINEKIAAEMKVNSNSKDVTEEDRGLAEHEWAYVLADTFVGRGPLQVTHNYVYVRTLVYMEELAKKRQDKDAQLLLQAIDAIKNDPSQAANPKYSFLFSAVYMHMAGGVAGAGNIHGEPAFNGVDGASGWIAGQEKSFQAQLSDANSEKARLEALPDDFSDNKGSKQDQLAKVVGTIGDIQTHIGNAKKKSDTYIAIKGLLLKKAGGNPSGGGNTPGGGNPSASGNKPGAGTP